MYFDGTYRFFHNDEDYDDKEDEILEWFRKITKSKSKEKIVITDDMQINTSMFESIKFVDIPNKK